MVKGDVVISLFDYTGNAVRDWAEAGYDCFCYDLLHDIQDVTVPVGLGSITYCYADLTPGSSSYAAIARRFAGVKVAMVFSFPPCTDMAGSGAKHWAIKAAADPDFQVKAARMASYSAEFAESLGAEYVVENPVGALTKLWRKWDYIFDPFMFGGYLPEDDVHPRWPKYIAPRDAYPKKTCHWLSAGVVEPVKKPVEPEILEQVSASGKVIRGGRQTILLGGKSRKTKSIRDETPRGWARAFFEANSE